MDYMTLCKNGLYNYDRYKKVYIDSWKSREAGLYKFLSFIFAQFFLMVCLYAVYKHI